VESNICINERENEWLSTAIGAHHTSHEEYIDELDDDGQKK
jgi:hypothetical protein